MSKSTKTFVLGLILGIVAHMVFQGMDYGNKRTS